MVKKLNKCIGIISYLPNDIEIRRNRFAKLCSLINKVNQLFNLPIILLAQNYNEAELKQINCSNLSIVREDKPLGIAHARDALRKYFLTTKYDVIILLDDDCEIMGNDASDYLMQIDNNPNKLGVMKNLSHKLMSVPRCIYEKYSYDLVNSPENHLGFEDAIFYCTVVRNDESRRFIFRCSNLKEISTGYDKENSSWSKNVSKEVWKKMADNTNKIIYKLQGIDDKFE